MDLTVWHKAKPAKQICMMCCAYSAYADFGKVVLEDFELELIAESLTTASVLMPESQKKAA